MVWKSQSFRHPNCFGIRSAKKNLWIWAGTLVGGVGWLAIKKQQFAPEKLRKGPLLRKQAGSSMIPNQIHFSGANLLWKISGFYPRVYLQTFCFAYPGIPFQPQMSLSKKYVCRNGGNLAQFLGWTFKIVIGHLTIIIYQPPLNNFTHSHMSHIFI